MIQTYQSSEKKNENEKDYLWWEDPRTKKRQFAGIAYYNSKTQDYTLKVSLLGKEKVYLKMIGSNDGKIIYRVEKVIMLSKHNSKRFLLGEGESSNETGHSIYMTLGPMKHLVLDQRSKSE